MIVGYLFQQPLGCGAVVADAGAAMEHEGVVVVGLGPHDLGDLHSRLVAGGSEVEDLDVAKHVRVARSAHLVGSLADGGHGHLSLADGRRSHGVDVLRRDALGAPGGDVVAVHAPVRREPVAILGVVSLVHRPPRGRR